MRTCNISATRVKKYRRCHRLWFAEDVLGIEAPERSFSSRGTEVHAQIASRLATGRWSEKPDPLAKLAVKTLPERLIKPESKPRVESPIEIAGISGTPDLVFYENGVVVIVDWKTCASYDYALPPELLAHDEQAITYAAYFFQFETTEAVVCRWVYLKTSGKPFVWTSTAHLSRRVVKERFAPIERDAIEMRLLAESSIDDIRYVPGAPNAPHAPQCAAFGGCFLADRCATMGTPFGT